MAASKSQITTKRKKSMGWKRPYKSALRRTTRTRPIYSRDHLLVTMAVTTTQTDGSGVAHSLTRSRQTMQCNESIKKTNKYKLIDLLCTLFVICKTDSRDSEFGDQSIMWGNHKRVNVKQMSRKSNKFDILGEKSEIHLEVLACNDHILFFCYSQNVMMMMSIYASRLKQSNSWQLKQFFLFISLAWEDL